MARDIHKIDNYLIRLGWLVLAFALMGAGCSSGDREYLVIERGSDGSVASEMKHRSSDELAAVAARFPRAEVALAGGAPIVKWLWMLAAAVTMLGVGYHVRRRENQALAVWNILERALEVSAAELAHSAGITRERLRSVMALINAQPGAHYVWDPHSDRVFDGRLAQQVARLDACSSCGARINQAVALHLANLPVCSYCGASASTEDLQRLRREMLDGIRDEKPPAREFSVVIFILLLLFFWPAALVYALWKSGVIATWLEALRGSPDARGGPGHRHPGARG